MSRSALNKGAAGHQRSRSEIVDRFSVSRETAEKLILYVGELTRWQSVRNLVGPATLAEVWDRHIADSLQLASLSDATGWADLGSGAGLPGLILAIARPEIHVDLVESDGRKCAFLRETARVTGANVAIWDGRIEAMLPHLPQQPAMVTARALAALPKLLELSESLLIKGSVALFPKGRTYEAELTEALRSWTFKCDVLPSRTDSDGRILRISDFGGRRPLQTQIGDHRDHA
jgi:16S rRNA (guanine527-N7)-methyltransferase